METVLHSIFSYQTKDWEGEFKASNNSASHFNPVAMANESYKKYYVT